jgi:hypothetical protein
MPSVLNIITLLQLQIFSIGTNIFRVSTNFVTSVFYEDDCLVEGFTKYRNEILQI